MVPHVPWCACYHQPDCGQHRSGVRALGDGGILLLSNVAQNAIIGNDDSVTGGSVGAVTLIAVNAAVNHRWW
jgi:hypothetical protein